MGTYRQYCPVARASEILAERWNPLIVRNLMFGADTFSAIARGVPTMSRSLLLKRLDELERAGVIESHAKTKAAATVTDGPRRAPTWQDWHRGARSWRDAIRSGEFKLTGPAWLRRSFPKWNAHRLT